MKPLESRKDDSNRSSLYMFWWRNTGPRILNTQAIWGHGHTIVFAGEIKKLFGILTFSENLNLDHIHPDQLVYLIIITATADFGIHCLHFSLIFKSLENYLAHLSFPAGLWFNLYLRLYPSRSWISTLFVLEIEYRLSRC